LFIDSDTAKRRLNDPGNIVNRLLEIGLGRSNSRLPESAPSEVNGDTNEVLSDNPSDSHSSEGLAGASPTLTPEELSEAEKEEPRIRISANRTSPMVKRGESTVINRNRHGRTVGATTVDSMTREIAGTLTRIEGPASVARAFEIAPSTAFHMGRADGKKDGELRERIEKNLGKVRDIALDRLMTSINLIEDDKLESLGAKDLSTVASNLSRVVEKTLPRDMSAAPTAQLIVYAPTIAKEEHYETVVLQG